MFMVHRAAKLSKHNRRDGGGGGVDPIINDDKGFEYNIARVIMYNNNVYGKYVAVDSRSAPSVPDNEPETRFL